MSARVFKPINTEYQKMRSPLTDRKIPCRIAKVKRVLFEPIDPVETRNFLKREFDKQALIDSQKWEFDFVRGIPLTPDGTDTRYEWNQVTDYVNHAPVKRRDENVVPDNSDLYGEPNNILKPTPLRPDQTKSHISEIPKENKKQVLITDYMAIRKRSSDSAFAKKTEDVRPPKVARSYDVTS